MLYETAARADELLLLDIPEVDMGNIHPIHLHRNTFEVTHIAGTPTAGLRKDMPMLGGYQEMAICVVTDQTGASLLHCHQQLHMDYGFMALLRVS
ncbi:multicopper oxidase domain-containing protein [Nocardia sp. NPDC101769]|uniref:multicopper oxidase domain-containing protein n=1 Tax=Nocardia sp. NPDC101769 TaxID=3364333 RepID=UPI0037FDF25D